MLIWAGKHKAIMDLLWANIQVMIYKTYTRSNMPHKRLNCYIFLKDKHELISMLPACVMKNVSTNPK
jgi:hypothetical protein